MATTAELKRLHEMATETRNAAHRAYTTALRNTAPNYDTKDAYDTLLKANGVMARIYAMVLESIVKGR